MPDQLKLAPLSVYSWAGALVPCNEQPSKNCASAPSEVPVSSDHLKGWTYVQGMRPYAIEWYRLEDLPLAEMAAAAAKQVGRWFTASGASRAASGCEEGHGWQQVIFRRGGGSWSQQGAWVGLRARLTNASGSQRCCEFWNRALGGD
ncbi:hypothetical protein HaLaN_01538 [Haematococcus lacustris]|uniref:Uncharacterized protein n=1 Tax=Haematococcus lacustris TaxID=44745 RepID=A0A699YIY8_HAELA|nr:hypothetical protein HaLaN_01538 [Haematococcus lacustris]